MRKSERDCKEQYEKDGWMLLKNGWPDFLAVREVDGKVEAKGIETKGIYRKSVAKLSPEQVVMREWLEKLGIKVEVAYFKAGANDEIENEQEQMRKRVKKRSRRKSFNAEKEEARDLKILTVLKEGGLDAAKKKAA